MTPPASLPVPSPNVYYRIQNLDWAEYLELYSFNDEKVVTRPLKDRLEQQVCITSYIHNLCAFLDKFSRQWTFIPSGTGGLNYHIQNAATQFLRNPRYLSIEFDDADTPNAIAVTEEDDPKVWTIKEAGPNGVFR
jgi:hypothetical protein